MLVLEGGARRILVSWSKKRVRKACAIPTCSTLSRSGPAASE